MKHAFDEIGVSILAASVDAHDKAAEVQGGLEFPVAYEVTRDQADSIGSWWEDRRSIIQPSEFILNRLGKVVSSTYSTGPVGRLMPEDAMKLIKFLESLKNK
ncbi:hypothetical protein [Candidatus Rariloculus sp.]|uniref:hypothetical protein n=1 Tax=Candidatus Rariloculus sp. TaxID=3101265 RepID=UPI003D12F942